METMAELATAKHTETYRLVDDIPEVYVARLQERLQAEDLLEQRRDTYETTGELSYQPVDALSTAHSVLEAKREFGENSWEHEQRWEGLLLDCQRLVGEWYRKKRPEYFAPTRHVFDEEREEFFSHGLSIRQMTENALTPMADNQEEESRRINERVEDATPQLLRSLGKIAIGTEAIRTISECTDGAIENYTFDLQQGRAHRGYNGYVPEIEKVMIRDIRLDPHSNDRFEEQIGLPGVYINHDVIQTALSIRGADVHNADKTKLHGSQILVKDDLLDFVKTLDDVAEQKWKFKGKALFMGEVVTADHPKNYETFRQEALQRQDELKGWAETVALFVLDLAEEGFDRRKAPAHVEEFVKEILMNLAKHDQTIAEQMFDVGTVEGILGVAFLESQGRFEEAKVLWDETRAKAPGGGFCGAGSCGLEGVANSKEEQELRKQLKAESGDTIIKDKERPCRCGKKSIVYAFNKSKVNKLCQSCGAFESKISKAA
jgi:hypothetical protein